MGDGGGMEAYVTLFVAKEALRVEYQKKSIATREDGLSMYEPALIVYRSHSMAELLNCIARNL